MYLIPITWPLIGIGIRKTVGDGTTDNDSKNDILSYILKFVGETFFKYIGTGMEMLSFLTYADIYLY